MKIFFLISFFGVSIMCFGQFPDLEYDLVNNGISLKFNTDYEKLVKLNHVKRATTSCKYGDPSGSNPVTQSAIYEYDNEGRVIKCSNSDYYKNNSLKKYDSAGKLLERVVMDFETNDTIEKWNFEYDDRNKINKKILFSKDDSTTHIFIDENVYDQQNRLIRRDEHDTEMKGTRRTYLFFYDTQDKLIEFKQSFSGSYFLFDILFSYDSLDRITEIKYKQTGIDYKIVYNKEGQMISCGFNIPIITYNAYGLIDTISYNNGVDGGHYVYTYKYEYYLKRKRFCVRWKRWSNCRN